MSMLTDVRCSAPLAATGQFLEQNGTTHLGRVRIKALYIVSGASAGVVTLYDGTSADANKKLMTINTPAAANLGAYPVLIPGQGVLVSSKLYGTITNTSSVVVFYG